MLPFVAGLFALAPRRLDALRERVLALVYADTRKFDRARAPRRLPAERSGAFHIPQPRRRGFETRVVCLYELFLALRLGKRRAQRVHAPRPVRRLTFRA